MVGIEFGLRSPLRRQETPYSRLPRAPKGRAGRLRDGYSRLRSPLRRGQQTLAVPACGSGRGCGVRDPTTPQGGRRPTNSFRWMGRIHQVVSYRRANTIPTGSVGRWVDSSTNSKSVWLVQLEPRTVEIVVEIGDSSRRCFRDLQSRRTGVRRGPAESFLWRECEC